jgi:tight adherence protein C
MNAIDQFTSTLMDPIFLATVFSAVAIFAAVLTVFWPMFTGDKLDARLKQVATKREEMRRKSRAALEQQATLRQNSKGFVRDTVDRLNLRKLLQDDGLEDRLTQAGLRGQGPVNAFYFARMAAPIGFGAAAIAYVFLGKPDWDAPMKLLAIVGAIVLGFYAPILYLKNAAAKRVESVMRAFPDALDMLLICVESGMSIETALHRVSGEIGSASIELAEEFSLTHAELSFLQDRRIAYENLAKRTNHPGVKAVAMALVQAERYGTPLGTALRVMAKENRELRIAAAEKKAAALPAQLTVPMIVFFLPCLFLVILGPAVIQMKDMGIIGK